MSDKKWMGSVPRECDVCHSPITTVFVDGKGTHGVGLGVGRGQRYELVNNEWVKTAG